MTIEKCIITGSRNNGVQVSIELKAGETWHYAALGIHDGVDLVYSHATPDDVTEPLRWLAEEAGENPVRTAASNRITGNFKTLLDTREWFE